MPLHHDPCHYLVAPHPRDSQWSGYAELMGLMKRNRLLDIDRFLELLDRSSMEDSRARFETNFDSRCFPSLYAQRSRMASI